MHIVMLKAENGISNGLQLECEYTEQQQMSDRKTTETESRHVMPADPNVLQA